MAEASDNKNSKNLGNFADDLDALLDAHQVDSSDQVELMADDDALDHMLIGDNFNANDSQLAHEAGSDIDHTLVDDLKDQQHMQVDMDEFDEIYADQAMSTSDIDQPLDFEFEVLAELDNISQTPDSSTELEDIAEDSIPELVIDISDDQTNQDQPSEVEFEQLAKRRNLDAQTLEFDISPDEQAINLDKVQFDQISDTIDLSDSLELASPDTATLADEQFQEIDITAAPPIIDLGNDSLGSTSDDALDTQYSQIAASNLTLDLAKPLQAENSASNHPDQPLANPTTDHSAEIALLNQHLNGLKKQLLAFKQEMTEKASKIELNNCLEEIENLQAEQRKSKRNIETISGQKPVLSYASIALAITALLVGIVIGVQGYITKSQLTEVSQLFVKLQEQINVSPDTEAAEKEVMRKELESLSLADSVANNQLAELKKQLSDNSNKPSTDNNKQWQELNNQTLQIGATIEKLESRVGNLEKSKVSAAPAPVVKAEKKKPVPVEENWAVNLVAFKQDWYAKRKAEEYARLGIPAKVSRSVAKGEEWYRISVDGFKSQYEAAGYAARVKKTLNLDSVWLAKVPNNANKE